MASLKTVELFSKRSEREKNSGKPDVYQFDEIPEKVLYQISLVLTEVIGTYWLSYDSYPMRRRPNNNLAWDFLIKTMAREHGNPSFVRNENSLEACLDILKLGTNILLQLDLIDLAFSRVVPNLASRTTQARYDHGAKISSEEAIEELNYRLREGGVGYQFAGGQIVRVDSQYYTLKPLLLH